MLEAFITWLLDTLLDLGYVGIAGLMALESSVLPVPSELVMPPAGYWAAKGEMNFGVVVACGVIGSILGALANYYGARWLGLPLLRRYGKYVLLTEGALERSERFFARHGEFSTFVGRLLPVVRHLISIPAGLHGMPLPRFMAYTGLGSLVWCTILTWIGYFLGQHDGVLRNEEIRRRVGQVFTYLVPLLAILAIAYAVWHRRRSGRVQSPGAGA